MAKGNLKSERDLVWVVQGASALSLGTLAGLLYSMKSVSPRIQFGFTLATPLAFALAALASLAFWQVVFALNEADENPSALPAHGTAQRARKRWLAVLATALAIGLVLAFIYPLKDFSRDKQSEISFGALIAVAFLSVLALLFWRVVRYLENPE